MKEKREQSIGLYSKTESTPGVFTINGFGGNTFINAGIKRPSPISEELADILVKELNYIYDDEDKILFNDDVFSASMEYSELVSLVDISAFKVIAELMKAKNDNSYFRCKKTLDIDNALEYDCMLTMDVDDTEGLNSDYMNKAKAYFGKYNLKIPLLADRLNYGDLIDDEYLFDIFLNKKIAELSRPEKIALVHIFKKLKGFSITLPYLWIMNVIDDTDMAEAFIDSLYKLDYVTDLDLGKLDLNNIDVMEAVLSDKLFYLRQAIDVYIKDAVKMFPN